MGLVQELSSAGGIPEKSTSGDTRITSSDIAESARSAVTYRSALSPTNYPDIYGTLLSYPSGVPVIVEYYKKRGPYIATQTIDTSFSGERAAIHFSFDCIHNLEIRIDGELEFDTNVEATELMITGTAIVYPGIKPNLGDIILMKLPDGIIGVFVVNLTEPLSIRRGSHYKINFHLDSNLNEATMLKLKEATVDELYFEKQHFFSDEAALLTSTSYNQIETLVRHKQAIISRIMNKFYSVSEKTVICPNAIYDPFLIEYLMNKISINDCRKHLTMLANPFVASFENTIWMSYLNQDITSLSLIGYILHKYRQYLFDVNMSNIDIFRMISLIDPNKSFDPARFVQEKFNITDPDYRAVSYYFSDRFYYALLQSFETGSPIIDILPLIDDMSSDTRIYQNLNTSFYSFIDNTYHDIEFFDSCVKATGSNNDLHIPEYEYLVYDFIINNNIDIDYLINKVLSQFPFNKMTEYDQLYLMSILLHLIDVAIIRIR